MSTMEPEFLMLIFAGWANRSQQDAVEYLQEENRVSVIRTHPPPSMATEVSRFWCLRRLQPGVPVVKASNSR